MYYDAFEKLNKKREVPYKIAAIFSYDANEDMDGKGDKYSQIDILNVSLTHENIS